MFINQRANSQIDPIFQYIKDGTLPVDKSEARKIKIIAVKYYMLDGELYRRSYIRPLLRCLGPESALKVVAEMHEEHCGNHSTGRSSSKRIMLQEIYWPTLLKDSKKHVKECDKCQKFVNELSTMSSPWPFIQWGLDIVGPLPQAPTQNKFILVATDYFSKQIKAESYAIIKTQTQYRLFGNS